MKSINKITVSIFLGNHLVEVGELVKDEEIIYFKYNSDFLKLDINISPFKLPFTNEILTPETSVFDGLFGVFDDSLPDGWGKLLLDKHLQSNDVSLTQISPLDRLAYLDGFSKGALVYEPKVVSNETKEVNFELDKVADASQKLLKGEDSQNFLDDLRKIGGSSGGARPKIFVGYNQENDKLLFGGENLPENYSHWIIKFRATEDVLDMANVEFAYYKMAVDAGIEITESQLFYDKLRQAYFGTKRFDRKGNDRIHVHSVAGLLHDNYRFSNLDYGHIMDAAFRLEKNVMAYEKVLRLAIFNTLTHNKDDHSKNFSFLMDAQGTWSFAPAYDLTFSYSSHGMQSTTVAGEGKQLQKKHFEKLAKIYGVKNWDEIYGQVLEVVKNWKKYAKKCGVSLATTQLIERELQEVRQ